MQNKAGGKLVLTHGISIINNFSWIVVVIIAAKIIILVTGDCIFEIVVIL